MRFALRRKVEGLALRPCEDKVFTLCKASFTPVKLIFFDAKKASATNKSMLSTTINSYFSCKYRFFFVSLQVEKSTVYEDYED